MRLRLDGTWEPCGHHVTDDPEGDLGDDECRICLRLEASEPRRKRRLLDYLTPRRLLDAVGRRE